MKIGTPAARSSRLALTPLIDVIFLLLLFFMLSSTFSRFAEIEITAGGGGGVAGTAPPIFVQLREEEIRINGRVAAMDETEGLLGEQAERGSDLILLSTDEATTSQRFIDVYAMLVRIDGLNVAVLR